MSKKQQKKPSVDMRERYYSPPVLAAVFAVVALFFLFAVFVLFMSDYRSEWREHQQKFKQEKIRYYRDKVSDSRAVLDQDVEYEALMVSLEQLQLQLEAEESELFKIRGRLKQLEEAYVLSLRAYQHKKASYDEFVFHYEKLRHEEFEGGHGDTKKLHRYQLDLQLLKDVAEADRLAIEKDKERIDELQSSVHEVKAQIDNKTQDYERYLKALRQVDKKEMSLENRLADDIRDLPVMEIFAPSYKIQQNIYPHLKENLNFSEVPIVSRCVSCHVGITQKGFEDLPQPLATHPHLDLFVGSSSAHPIDKISCVSCHEGRSRGTSFSSAAHTPQNEEQAQEWKDQWGWEEFHHWDKPMLPLQLTQSSCFKCHDSALQLKGAENLMTGLQLVDSSGCFQCHTMGERFDSICKKGPTLLYVASKLSSQDWVYRWLVSPHNLRPGSRMPSFWEFTDDVSEEDQKRSYQEIHAVASYLWSHSKNYDVVSEIPENGDIDRGEELVAKIGCLACHNVDPEWEKSEELYLEDVYRQFGPNLVGLLNKTSSNWLYMWLKNPSDYHKETAMPSMRLTDQEAADITAYLFSEDLMPVEDTFEIPPYDDEVVNEIALDFMLSSMTRQDATLELNSMPSEKKLNFVGEKLIRHYLCMNCHEIPGMEGEQIKVPLDNIADRNIHEFDFGHLHDLPHTRYAWLKQKLKDPRSFDRGKLKSRLEKYKMPNFHFSDEEAEALSLVLLGLTNQNYRTLPVDLGSESNYIKKGRRIIRENNCQACHVVEGFFDDESPLYMSVMDWLIDYEGKDEFSVEDSVAVYLPPDLLGEGRKVKSEWLFDYFFHPYPIRPVVKIRMPSFHWHHDDVNALLAYFAYRDSADFPFEAYHRSEGVASVFAGQTLASSDYFSCYSCHVQGETKPDGDPETWAPDLAQVRRRLRPQWIIDWLRDPQKVLPGTAMPTFFDPEAFDTSGPEEVLRGDEEKQLLSLKDYVMSLGEK